LFPPRRHGGARPRRRDRAAPRPRGSRPRAPGGPHGRHAAGGRARRGARRRRGPARRGVALRSEHARRGRGQPLRDLPRARAAGLEPHRLVGEPLESRAGARGSPAGGTRGSAGCRAAGEHGARTGRRRARRARPRRGRGRRLRLPAHGAGLVPDAHPAPRRLHLYLRTDPHRRAGRHRRGRARLRRGGARPAGRGVGLAYASNTLGAIVGSLAGGFGLIPLLTAPGAWRAVVLVLVALGAACLLQALRGGAALRGGLVPLGLGLASVLLCLADGPTAFWRHSAIGAGRLEATFTAPNDLRRLLDERRRRIVWEADGIESAVALDAWNAYGFLINGKNDGNTIGDAPTQVMLGLIGALQHPRPRTALVIGLGTGSTAGWLAQ